MKKVYCGIGCNCLTQCGDAYELHGEQKPPKPPMNPKPVAKKAATKRKARK